MHHTVPHYVGFDTCQVAFSTVNHICASTSQISPCFIPTKAYKGTGWWCVVRLFDTLFITISIISFVGLPALSFLLKTKKHNGFLVSSRVSPHVFAKPGQSSHGRERSGRLGFFRILRAGHEGNPMAEALHFRQIYTNKHYLYELSPRGWSKHARLQDITQNIISTPGMIIKDQNSDCNDSCSFLFLWIVQILR